MKKQILALASIVMVGGAISFTSCKQDDITAPVITVTGGNNQSQSLPAVAGAGTWTNPAATATDDEDGDLTSAISVTGTVDPDNAAQYILTYSVSDAAGNTATETVTVNIVNDAKFFEGEYNCTEVCQVSTVAPYTNDWTASTTVNNDLNINNFGGFGNSIDIDADWNGSNTLTISTPQTLGATGSIVSCNATYTASGSTVNATIVYAWNDGVNNETCTTTASK